MKYTLEILRKVERDLLKKKKALEDILYARPLSEICTLRIKFSEIIKEYGVCSKEAIDFANKNADVEKKLFALAKRQSDYNDLTDKVSNINVELHEIRNQIEMINIKNDFISRKKLIATG